MNPVTWVFGGLVYLVVTTYIYAVVVEMLSSRICAGVIVALVLILFHVGGSIMIANRIVRLVKRRWNART